MFVAQPPIAGQPTKQVSPATPTTWWRWIFCYTNCHWKPQGCGNPQRHAVRSDVCSTCCGCRIHTSNDRTKKSMWYVYVWYFCNRYYISFITPNSLRFLAKYHRICSLQPFGPAHAPQERLERSLASVETRRCHWASFAAVPEGLVMSSLPKFTVFNTINHGEYMVNIWVIYG